MSKRKLNRRQKWRIEKIQQDKLARQRRSQRKANDIDESELGQEQDGIIISHFGQQVEVASEDAPEERFRCFVRANVENLVAGDRVLWQPATTDDIGIVIARHSRESELGRPDPINNRVVKPMAANVDQMVIVIAPQPAPTSQLVDRYLIAAKATGLHPVILLNKVDLIKTEEQSFAPLLSIYRQLGYEVTECSTKVAQGLDGLKATLKGHTSIFVGQSGVGKSSLVNALLPDIEQQKTSPLSESSGQGQHTTTTARVFFIPDGGHLIDSPGIREFGIWNLTDDQLESGYPEISQYSGLCKFRDCSHTCEPQCAVLEAVEQGKISPERYQNYINLKQQLECNG